MLNHELRPLLVADQYVADFLKAEYTVNFGEAKLLKDNFNFVFATPKLILRFSPASKKSKREIEAEIHWTAYLNARRLPVNEIIRGASGNVCHELTVAGQLLYLVVFLRCMGTPLEYSNWGSNHFAKLGTLAGQLHRSSRAFHDQVTERFPHWHQHSKAAVLHDLPDDQRQLPRILEKLLQRFNQLATGPEDYGIIHYDIHQGNYFILTDQPRHSLFLFDFEMTCQGWYLQDIAVILYYASNLNTTLRGTLGETFEQDFLKAFLVTYQPLMPEVVIDEALIQAHLLYRDLFVYAYVLDAWRGRERSAGDQRLLDLLTANIARRSKAQGFI